MIFPLHGGKGAEGWGQSGFMRYPQGQIWAGWRPSGQCVMPLPVPGEWDKADASAGLGGPACGPQAGPWASDALLRPRFQYLLWDSGQLLFLLVHVSDGETPASRFLSGRILRKKRGNEYW